jgi:hypothetical protein
MTYTVDDLNQARLEAEVEVAALVAAVANKLGQIVAHGDAVSPEYLQGLGHLAASLNFNQPSGGAEQEDDDSAG